MGKEKSLERRDFIKMSAGVSALGVLGLAGCAPSSSGADKGDVVSAQNITWDETADVVVVGGGGSGFCAAIEAEDAGSSVIVLEKSDMFGGDTVLSNGMILGAGTELQQSLADYSSDTAEKFAEQQIAYAQGYADEEMIKEMCLNSAESVQFMLDLGRTYQNVDFVPPIWACDTEGTWAPRCHWTNTESGGDAGETGHFATLNKRVESSSNIVTYKKSEVTRLVVDDGGEVAGVECMAGSQAKYYKADNAVILASCSWGHNKDMAKRYNPMLYWGHTLTDTYGANRYSSSPYNTGDGIRMAMALGADLALSPANVMLDRLYFGGVGAGYYNQVAGIDYSNEYFATAIPGKILVNKYGNRFVQEDADWGYVNQQVFNENIKTGGGADGLIVWAIQDMSNASKDALSLSVIMGDPESDPYVTLMKTAETLEDLAKLIDIPAENLRNTVDRWNGFSAEASDPDFERRTDFGTIEQGPFFAFPFIPNVYGGLGGLKTDSETRVLDVHGEPIPRLYAAGTIMSGMWTGPFYPGCGWAILGTVHWGRKAGKNAAALNS